mmetsp:Transcript_28227/g.89895  ORF Transcript_28227/g.89895 Transcript_28227/m.89895 type:complete len:91 (-) Transcript_28227:248-520(-)
MSVKMDPYAVLGLPRNAPAQEVKKAYRKLAMLHHPDQHPPEARAAAEETFKRVQDAYSKLTDKAAGDHMSTQSRPGSRHGTCSPLSRLRA